MSEIRRCEKRGCHAQAVTSIVLTDPDGSLTFWGCEEHMDAFVLWCMQKIEEQGAEWAFGSVTVFRG